jgi:hypothetical protein
MSDGELGGFGDLRLRRTGEKLLSALQATPSMCLRALAEDRNQERAFGRFLDNPAVSADEMLVHAGQLTARRVAGRHVLAIQDTTELHFPGHSASRTGFGRAGNGDQPGFYLHPTLAVDAANGGIIGLVGAQVINRTEGKAGPRRSRAADAKESRRWLAGAEMAGAMLEPAAMITVVADRESDVYDQFARRPERVHLLSRAAQDRALEAGQLFAHAAGLPQQGGYQVHIPRRAGRPGRTASIALRWGEVALQRPATAARSLPSSVTLRLVDAREIDPPAGETPVHWCLLTTHAVDSGAQARQIVQWYAARWTIEQVFRTLKTAGMQAEASQVEDAKRMIKLAVAALIAAVRVMQIVIGRDGSTGQPLTDAADPADLPALRACNAKLQGRTDKLKNPNAPATLAWFAWLVARLGGWSGYCSKGYKPPGPKTIARGLIKLDGIIQGWNLAHSAHVRLP